MPPKIDVGASKPKFEPPSPTQAHKFIKTGHLPIYESDQISLSFNTNPPPVNVVYGAAQGWAQSGATLGGAIAGAQYTINNTTFSVDFNFKLN